jgi:hypothetical protein
LEWNDLEINGGLIKVHTKKKKTRTKIWITNCDTCFKISKGVRGNGPIQNVKYLDKKILIHK